MWGSEPLFHFVIFVRLFLTPFPTKCLTSENEFLLEKWSGENIRVYVNFLSNSLSLRSSLKLSISRMSVKITIKSNLGFCDSCYRMRAMGVALLIPWQGFFSSSFWTPSGRKQEMHYAASAVCEVNCNCNENHDFSYLVYILYKFTYTYVCIPVLI